MNNGTSIISKDVQTSTREVNPVQKSCQKNNGLEKNKTNNDHSNTNELENGTNSGHSSSNESNNIDKRKKGIYIFLN
jgi:hypothetical protein